MACLIGATLPTTGFTRVLARPKGVFSQPRNAAKKSLAVQYSSANHSPLAFSRERVTVARETVVRSGLANLPGFRTDFEEPLSLITKVWKTHSICRCSALGMINRAPRSTFKSSLISLSRSPDKRPSRPKRQITPAAFRTRWKADDVQQLRSLDSAKTRSSFVAHSPLAELRAITDCKPSINSNEPFGTLSAIELALSSRVVSSVRTRNTQRVPYEERNARQCAAAGREPDCHC